MRQFNLQGEWCVEHPHNRDPNPGRTIHPERMRMAEGGWHGPNHRSGEHVIARESDIEEEQHRAAREWLWHVENGRMGPHLNPAPLPSAGEGRLGAAERGEGPLDSEGANQ